MPRTSKGLQDYRRQRVQQQHDAPDTEQLPRLGDGSPYRARTFVRLPHETLQDPPTEILWVNRPREPGDVWTAVLRGGRGTWPLSDLVADDREEEQ